MVFDEIICYLIDSLNLKQLNRLNDKEWYNAVAAKSIHTTSHLHQGVPGVIGVDHYVIMERDLYEYVNNHHSFGGPIETWMLMIEAKEKQAKSQEVSRIALIAIHGDEDVSYPLKFRNC